MISLSGNGHTTSSYKAKRIVIQIFQFFIVKTRSAVFMLPINSLWFVMPNRYNQGTMKFNTIDPRCGGHPSGHYGLFEDVRIKLSKSNKERACCVINYSAFANVNAFWLENALNWGQHFSLGEIHIWLRLFVHVE